MKPIPPYRGPKRVLVELMDEVSLKIRLFRKEVWNVTIELIADHLGLMENPWKYSLPDAKWKGPVGKPNYPGLQQLKEQIQKTGLIEGYIEGAKKEPWDHLGDIFVEEELAGRANRLGQCLTPRGIIEFMVKVTLGDNMKKPYSYTTPDLLTRVWLTDEALKFNDKLAETSINLQAERARWHTVIGMRPLLVKYDPEPITDLDPATGTGRFLIVASQMCPKAPLMLYGIEIDLSLYRACLANMALFSHHPYSIICADTLMIDEKYCGVNSRIWDLGNQWNPPSISQFYYKPIPPFKFSLKDLAKAVRPVEAKTEVPTAPEAQFSLAQLVKAKK